MTEQTPASAQKRKSQTGKTGILLGNLGTPDGTGYWAMRRYLSEFLSDPYVVDLPRWKWQIILQLIILTKRPFTSGAAYRTVWNTETNEGPLLTISRTQAEKLSEVLTKAFGNDVIVDHCMRYGNPSTDARLKALVAQGCERVLFFPLYPQFAGATTQTANESFLASHARLPNPPEIRIVPPYFDHPAYIAALGTSITQALSTLTHQPDLVIASFHGMPIRYVEEGDPYLDHCKTTAALLRAHLGMSESEFAVTFQSRFGREEWLQPYTVEEVARLAKSGTRRIAILAPGFSADCLETLEEIRSEIKSAFLDAGGEEFTYIPCLNATDDHIAMLAGLVESNLDEWENGEV